MTMFQRPGWSGPSAPGFRPPSGGSRGDRTLAQRVEAPREADHRKTKRTHQEVDRAPRGCLFWVGKAWFDLDGYFCVKKGDGKVRVTRGAPRKVMAKLTKRQRAALHSARTQAIRQGVR